MASKWICGICDRSMGANSSGIVCLSCFHWIHLACANLKYSEAKKLKGTFECLKCWKVNKIGRMEFKLEHETSWIGEESFLSNNAVSIIEHYLSKSINGVKGINSSTGERSGCYDPGIYGTLNRKSYSTCDICSQVFTKYRYLQTHMLVIHNIRKNLKYEDKKMKRFQKKYRPWRSTGIPSRRYPVCDKGILTDAVEQNDKSFLKSPVKDHDAKLNKYNSSAKALSNSKLSTILKVHNGGKLYKCSTCDKAFWQKTNFSNHMMIHSGVKSFKCELCNKCFTQKGNLKTHMMVHSGEKPYKCKVCSKAFVQSGNLRTHMLIHGEEKSHKCKICGRAFISMYRLAAHLKIHCGERLYQCDHCLFFFRTKRSLKKHICVHNREKS